MARVIFAFLSLILSATLPAPGAAAVSATETTATIRPTVEMLHRRGSGESFCFIADTKVHLNALLNGYQIREGLVARAWIKELGLLWIDSKGHKHRLHLVARRGREQERGDGFLSEAALDGDSIPIPHTPQHSFVQDEMIFTYIGLSVSGDFVVETFRVRIAGLLDFSVSLRVAHPALRLSDDAQVHFNLVINSISGSERLHGVLGEKQETQTALKYSDLSKLLTGGSLVYVAPSSEPVVQGSAEDYKTTGVLLPDCSFGSFGDTGF